MIDNGDEPEIETDANVGFIYEGDFDSEPLYIGTGIADHATITPLPFQECLDGTISKDSLMKFDVIVVGGSAAVEIVGLIGTEDRTGTFYDNLMNFVPMLVTWPRMQFGMGNVFGSNSYGYDVAEDLLEAELFKDVQFEETETGFILPMFDSSVADKGAILGGDLTEDFANDEVFATVDGHPAIYAHGKKNALLMIPFIEDYILLSSMYSMYYSHNLKE